MGDTGQPPGHSTWADEVSREAAASSPAARRVPGHHGGGARGGSQHGSWAQMLGSTLPTRLNKNVLEIVLEKDERGAFNVSDEDCFRLMKKIGLETIPGIQVEAVQICPNGRGVILITLKDNCSLEVFCRYDVFDVTASGIRAVNVKPAGKREVVVTVKGLHPNTRDEAVIDYLGKFGRVVTTKVVHATFGDGPLKGFKNGDRSFKVELKPHSNIGSYHILDGQKVTVRYPGQQQTCARCHETASRCAGGGMARRCEAAGGVKVELCDYIMGLWERIGYSPGVLEVAAVYDDHGEVGGEVEGQANPQTGGKFTPTKIVSEPERFTGVSVKQFPRDTDAGDIMEFLAKSGLPETHKESVLIKSNGVVTIKNLDNAVCLKLIENIHNKKHFNRKLFCNGIIPLTPEKPATSSAGAPATANSPPARSPPANVSQSEANLVTTTSTLITSTSAPVYTQTVTSPPSAVSVSPTMSYAGSLVHFGEDLHASNMEFTRRHSLSMRSPPFGSVAREILYSSAPSTAPSLVKTRSILSEIKQMSQQLSDFGSCVSSLSSSSEGDDDSEKNKKKNKNKRKSSKSPPERTYFLKKLNSEASPELMGHKSHTE